MKAPKDTYDAQLKTIHTADTVATYKQLRADNLSKHRQVKADKIKVKRWHFALFWHLARKSPNSVARAIAYARG